MENIHTFIAGVVEGFYGRPWTSLQRKKLFSRLHEFGLNTYLYAPKDDLKHRQMWRQLYTDEEVLQIKILIEASKQNNIIFVYAISPGLDIVFSSPTDIFLLQQKMKQILDLGCNGFSLLFDDIDTNLNATDMNSFYSLAHAQATISNDIYNFLDKPSFFLFCPTEYCTTRAIPSISESEYLKTIGNILIADIDIMWTGPKVISHDITVEMIGKLSKVLNRPPIIWDNIHANDYDQRRLFLGPYCGRSTLLRSHIRGVLLNPNCEFEANFIAIHTMAQWTRAYKIQDVNCLTDNNDCKDQYQPSIALESALIDWLKLLYTKENSKTLKPVNGSMMSITANSISQTHVFLPMISSKFIGQQSVKLNNQVNKEKDLQNSNNEKSISFNLKYIKIENFNLPKSGCNSDKESLIPESIADIETNIANSKNESYNYKTFYNEESSKESNAQCSQMDLVTKIDEILESSDNQNEMIFDASINSFPLTPMEIEDNQGDIDILTDSMAMQVDTIYESTCEHMDIIDDMENNSNLDRKKDLKYVISSSNMKSEMESVISNKSSDIPEIATCTASSKLTISDLYLLVNMFYLPYEHSPYAVKMLNLIYWLRTHEYLTVEKGRHFTDNISETPDSLINNVDNIEISLENNFNPYEWQEKAKEFNIEVERFRDMVDRFTAIPNRSILYDFYSYIQDMRHVLSTLISYVKWMGFEPGYNESLMIDDHEPWVFRGGLISEFQRMFPLEGSNDLFPNKVVFQNLSSEDIFSKSNTQSKLNLKTKDACCQYLNGTDSIERFPKVYMIQPYRSSYKNQLFNLCFDLLYNELSNDPLIDKEELNQLKLQKYKDLPGDRYLGSYLEFCCDTCFVIEDENEIICGYAIGTNKIKEFLKFRQQLYNFKMRKKYIDIQSNILTSGEHMPLDDTKLPKIEKHSIIQNLIKGFNTDDRYQDFEAICNSKTAALIYMELSDKYQKPLHGSDKIGLKLLKCVFSSLKNEIFKVESINYQTNPNFYEMRPHSDEQSYDGCAIKTNITPELHNNNQLISELTVFCEIETSNKSQADFYKQYGFDTSHVDGDISDVSFMSRYI